MYFAVKSLVFLECCVYTVSASWPPRVTGCPASEDLNEYNRCTLRLLREITPELPHGIKEANLPPLDPFEMEKLRISYNLPNLKIAANMTNIKIAGATNYDVEDLFANPHNLTIRIKLRMPFVQSQVDYNVRGKLLVLPMTSTGHFHGNFTNTGIEAIAVGKEFTDENNLKRIALDKIDVKLRIGDARIKLTSPPKFKAVADAVTNLFNTNKRLILNIATPLFERNTALIAKSLLEGALQTFVKEELIP